MEFFFKPEGVAIVGASANPSKGGHFILKNVLKGFAGGVYPVNPGYPEIDGLKCYPSVLQVPDPKELGLPVFGELYRAVECMAAVISRQEIPG